MRKFLVLIGVTGSIAAYKAVELVRRLRSFSDVEVIATRNALRLVSRKALEKAAGRKIGTDLFQGAGRIPPGTPSGAHPLVRVPHIEYAKKADLVLIAPATANILAKLAVGLADDLLSTACLYAKAPLWVVPAMNQNMWRHPAVQKNVSLLRRRGVRFFGPASGHLACGEIGVGRMVEPVELAKAVEVFFKSSIGESKSLWKKLPVLVTAGPTREPIDPVRFLTNRSSGRMGYALAEKAAERGAKVTLISGPTMLESPPGVRVIHVETARQMYEQVMRRLKTQRVVISAAAVADFKPKVTAKTKWKKSEAPQAIFLEQNPDILKFVLKRRSKKTVVVGFAAETHKVLENAMKKWREKPCDLLIVNRVGGGKGFDVERNRIWVLQKGSEKKIRTKTLPKEQIAEKILDYVERFLKKSYRRR